MRLLTTIATTLAQYHQFTATRRELDSRSDRQLADMGVERGDVVRLAWEEAERRFPLPAEGQDTRGFAKTSARSLDLALAGQR
jgi:uncharacterized protein YjiS (DUF1127 family)